MTCDKSKLKFDEAEEDAAGRWMKVNRCCWTRCCSDEGAEKIVLALVLESHDGRGSAPTPKRIRAASDRH